MNASLSLNVLWRASLLATLLILTACATGSGSRERSLDDTLRTYAATIRWGDIAQAESFIDPVYRAAHPLTDLDLERFRQVKFTSYNERPAVPVSPDEVRQSVEIGVVNLNTQAARSFIDQQIWRYDADAKRWLLSSGLPNLSRVD